MPEKTPDLPDIMERLLSATPDELNFFEGQIQAQLSDLKEDYCTKAYRLKKLLSVIKTLQPVTGQSSEPRTPKGFTRQEKAEIERLRGAGLSTREIAEAMGVSTERINKSLSHLGKPRTSPTPIALNGAATR